LIQVRSENDSIKERAEGLQKEVSALKTENQKLNANLQALRADLLLKLEGLQAETRTISTGFEEYKEFLKRPTKEVSRIKEDTEVRLRILEEKEKALEEKRKTLEERMKQLEEQLRRVDDQIKGMDLKITYPSKPRDIEKSPRKEEPAEIKEIQSGVEDLYKDAYDTFRRGNLDLARKKFDNFLKKYPNTELSDNAQFWIAETYFLKKDYERAILEYEKGITRYPEGDKVPASLYKQALAFLEIGDKSNAKNLLKRLIERYPHSEQADMAKKKLSSIK
jgi:tol-pal system protein YbgF